MYMYVSNVSSLFLLCLIVIISKDNPRHHVELMAKYPGNFLLPASIVAFMVPHLFIKAYRKDINDVDNDENENTKIIAKIM